MNTESINKGIGQRPQAVSSECENTILNKMHFFQNGWMGGFLDLDAETIEAELDEYWREIYKIHKVFMEYPLANSRVL